MISDLSETGVTPSADVNSGAREEGEEWSASNSSKTGTKGQSKGKEQPVQSAFTEAKATSAKGIVFKQRSKAIVTAMVKFRLAQRTSKTIEKLALH